MSNDAPGAARLDIRFVGSLSGRYALPGRSGSNGAPEAFACRSLSVSPTSFTLAAPVAGEIGEVVTVMLEHVGLLKGRVVRHVPGGFQADVQGDAEAGAKLAARIAWLKKKTTRQATDKRVNVRVAPRNPKARLVVGDTERECFIIDMSQSGAAISAAVRPPLDAPVAVGAVTGRVVRHMDVGFGIRFDEAQDLAGLEAKLTG